MMPPILFRDDRFVVLDKPPGLPVHPGPRGGPSVEDWFPFLSRLIAAQAEFAAGRAQKTYWAVVRGIPPSATGTIDAPLRRTSNRSGWRMVSDAEGQSAVTDWLVRGQAGDIVWLELHPHTGRTHQVRVHCALLGCPVLGDPIYGEASGLLHLLSRAIGLPLDPPLSATAPPPPHMRGALTRCGWRE